MKPRISKYRAKVLARQPQTLLGQRLAEALNGERPGAPHTQPFNFVNAQQQVSTHERLCTNAYLRVLNVIYCREYVS